jgi:hypothetical protein
VRAKAVRGRIKYLKKAFAKALLLLEVQMMLPNQAEKF